jgi:hypothetical protein
MSDISEEFTTDARSQKWIKEVHVQKIQEAGKDKHNMSFKYKIKLETNDYLPEIILKQTRINSGSFSLAIEVNSKNIKPIDYERIAQILAMQANAFADKTGGKHMTVQAQKNDALALQMLSRAMGVGLKPELDKSEYPENDGKTEEMIKQAIEIAGIQPKAPRP